MIEIKLGDKCIKPTIIKMFKDIKENIKTIKETNLKQPKMELLGTEKHNI